MKKVPLFAVLCILSSMVFSQANVSIAASQEKASITELDNAVYTALHGAGKPAKPMGLTLRPRENADIVSSAQFLSALKQVVLNRNEVLLEKESEASRKAFEEHFQKMLGTICGFIGGKPMADHIDDALFYAYTYQESGSKGAYLVKNYFNKAVLQKHFPYAVEFTYWPWTKEDTKLNGLYKLDVISDSGIIQLSLYDTFVVDSIAKALRRQQPGWDYGDSYADALVNLAGKENNGVSFGKNLAERMPILSVFVHETTHCVLQFANGASAGLAEKFPKDAELLYEGMTEFLNQRAMQWLAAGFEDFNNVTAYPEGVFCAALLFSLEPDGLFEWYMNPGPDSNARFAEKLAKRLETTRSQSDASLVCLPASERETFKKRFTDIYLKGGARSVDDLCSVFFDLVNPKLFWDSFFADGRYFRQMPMKLRLFVIANFFGKNMYNVGPDAGLYAQKVQDMLSKSKRKNWDSPEKTEIAGFLKDPEGEEKNTSPIGIGLVALNAKPDPAALFGGGDLPLGDPKKTEFVTGNGFVPEGPEKARMREGRLKVSTPGNPTEPRSSIPSVKEWFDKQWKDNPRGTDPGYAVLRDKMIADFSMDALYAVTDYVIAAKKIEKGSAAEWHKFLNTFLAPFLDEGKDNLKIPQVAKRMLGF